LVEYLVDPPETVLLDPPDLPSWRETQFTIEKKRERERERGCDTYTWGARRGDERSRGKEKNKCLSDTLIQFIGIEDSICVGPNVCKCFKVLSEF
jgi:hypothetical protein